MTWHQSIRTVWLASAKQTAVLRLGELCNDPSKLESTLHLPLSFSHLSCPHFLPLFSVRAVTLSLSLTPSFIRGRTFRCEREVIRNRWPSQLVFIVFPRGGFDGTEKSYLFQRKRDASPSRSRCIGPFVRFMVKISVTAEENGEWLASEKVKLKFVVQLFSFQRQTLVESRVMESKQISKSLFLVTVAIVYKIE